MFLMATSREEPLLARDTLIFLLQHLRFLINKKNSILILTSTSEIPGIEIDSLKITFNLPKEKVKKLQPQCEDFLEKKRVIVRKLTKPIGKIPSTTVSTFPAPLLLSIDTRKDHSGFLGGI